MWVRRTFFFGFDLTWVDFWVCLMLQQCGVVMLLLLVLGAAKDPCDGCRLLQHRYVQVKIGPADCNILDFGAKGDGLTRTPSLPLTT